MKIGIGADPYGVELKDLLKAHLLATGHAGVDLGGSADQPPPYYAVARALAIQVATGEFERGILICGTGMGMAILANKYPGVYAAVCEAPSTAVKARSVNKANVLTLGGLLTAPFKAKEITDAFLTTEFMQSWEPSIQSFLAQSMRDIRQLEAEVFQDSQG